MVLQSGTFLFLFNCSQSLSSTYLGDVTTTAVGSRDGLNTGRHLHRPAGRAEVVGTGKVEEVGFRLDGDAIEFRAGWFLISLPCPGANVTAEIAFSFMSNAARPIGDFNGQMNGFLYRVFLSPSFVLRFLM